jgi:hypothetical protein
MLTVDSGVFECSLETVAFIAECANLVCECSSVPEVLRGRHGYNSSFTLFEDYQTGGGGCRIVWADGFAWVSRHSGYAWADITQEVRELFREQGAKPVGEHDAYDYWHANPQIYGVREWERHLIKIGRKQAPPWYR